MEGLFDVISNVINFTQNNLISIFLIVIGSSIIIKITSKIVQIVVSIAIIILFVKLLVNMGLIGFPLPL